jgi:betaine lipid synthase
VWVGCPKTALHNTDALAKFDAAATNSPYLSPIRHEETRNQTATAMNANAVRQLRSKGFEAAVLNLSVGLPLPSFFYQNNHFRIYYNELLEKHTQFNNSYIYAFSWEDAKVDQRLLKLTSDDVVLAITSAGDNLLSYICDASPKRVHAVDLNPAQNHLLELKLACFSAPLPYEDIWQIFGEGRHPQFRELLISKLSPHLSSRAFQFWLERTSVFTSVSGGGLYETGQSGIALRATKWLFRIFGVTPYVKAMCAATTLNEQLEIWRSKVRPVILSWWLSWGVIGNERFLWKALGVPVNQRNMILEDYYQRERARGNTISSGNSGNAMWEYVVDTLDPVVENSLLGSDNYFYLLCLLGRYTKLSHPAYLSPRNYRKLTTSGAFSGMRIHTDEINEVLARLKPGTLTVAVCSTHPSCAWSYSF